MDLLEKVKVEHGRRTTTRIPTLPTTGTSEECATADELADAAEVSKEHARTTLRRLADEGDIEVRERAGRHGRHLYRALAGGSTEPALVDLDADEKPANEGVWVSSTWSLAVCSPNTAPATASPDDDATPAEHAREQLGLEAFGDGPPPG